MGNGLCTFRLRDLKGALTAVRVAGIKVERVEIKKNGTIVIVACKSDVLSDDGSKDANEWNVIFNDSGKAPIPR